MPRRRHPAPSASFESQVRAALARHLDSLTRELLRLIPHALFPGASRKGKVVPRAVPRARPRPPRNQRPRIDAETLRQTLVEQQGNVSACALVLGVHRRQVQRWIVRYGLAGVGR